MPHDGYDQQATSTIAMASVCFYFQVHHRPNAQLYITGLREAGTGNELFYYEIPLK